MRATKMLWVAVPVVFLIAIGMALWGPGPRRGPASKLRQIVVTADPLSPDDMERARQKIDEIYGKLENGANFAELAINESEARTAYDGGDMGWIGRGILPPRLENVAFQLEPGQYSDIIVEDSGNPLIYRILYVEKRHGFTLF
jgi:peptidyl-prolyl cis-trans isomerase SurA